MSTPELVAGSPEATPARGDRRLRRRPGPLRRSRPGPLLSPSARRTERPQWGYRPQKRQSSQLRNWRPCLLIKRAGANQRVMAKIVPLETESLSKSIPRACLGKLAVRRTFVAVLAATLATTAYALSTITAPTSSANPVPISSVAFSYAPRRLSGCQRIRRDGPSGLRGRPIRPRRHQRHLGRPGDRRVWRRRHIVAPGCTSLLRRE